MHNSFDLFFSSFLEVLLEVVVIVLLDLAILAFGFDHVLFLYQVPPFFVSFALVLGSLHCYFHQVASVLDVVEVTVVLVFCLQQ